MNDRVKSRSASNIQKLPASQYRQVFWLLEPYCRRRVKSVRHTLKRLLAEDTRLAVLASVAVAGAVLQALRPHHGLRDLPSASRAQYSTTVVRVSVVSAVSWCLCPSRQCSALVPLCSTSPFRSVRVRYESYYVSLFKVHIYAEIMFVVTCAPPLKMIHLNSFNFN